MTLTCPNCGHAMPIKRLGVEMTPMQAEIFDMIKSCPSGIDISDLFERIKIKRPAFKRHTIYVHVNGINNALLVTGKQVKKLVWKNARELTERSYYVGDREDNGETVAVRA